MKVWCILSFLVLVLTNVRAQESGWADSLGYRQQKLKTGAVQQVRFSLTGDSLFSVTKDSSWNLYVWDTFTGKLLSSRQFNNTNDTKVLSVWLAEDTKTYSITIQKHDTITATIYSTDKQAVINSTAVKLKDVTLSMAYYSLQTGNMWLVCNTYEPGDQWQGPTGIRSGILHHLKLINKSWVINHKYEGASYQVALSLGCETLCRMGHFRNVNYFRGHIIRDDHWLSSELIGDSILFRHYYDDELSDNDRELIESKLRRKSTVTPDSKNLFDIHMGNISLYISPHKTLSTNSTVPFYPETITAVSTNQHLIFSKSSELHVFHIGSGVIVDVIDFSFPISTVNYKTQEKFLLLGSTDGYLRIKSYNIYKSVSKTDFRTSHSITYPDASITFLSTAKEGAIQYYWNFGDGKTSQERYPSHTFEKSGLYSIILRVLYNTGNEDTVIKKDLIAIEPRLIPKFSADKVFETPPLEVHFTDQSEGNVQKWLWDFGDGTTDTVQNPTHIYNEQGTYYTSLRVTDKISSKVSLKNTLITTTTYSLDTVHLVNKIVNKAQNVYQGDVSSDVYSNRFLKGLYNTELNILQFFFQQCKTSHHYSMPGQRYAVAENISSFQKVYLERYVDDLIDANSCDFRGDRTLYTLLNYRDGLAITSLDFWYIVGTGYLEGLYLTNSKRIAPDGWSHNFDGAFFPDETDVFLFRKKGDSASLQFFANRDSLVKRIHIKTQFSRIFSSTDSNTLILISNPSFSLTDSTRYFTIFYFDLKGNIIKQNKVEKKTDCAISDILPLGNNEFLLCGYTAKKDSLGKLTKQQGYIVKINADGWILWEHFFPTWKSIRKIEKHPNGYYAGFGLPFENKKHGFIAFRSDGKLLSDYRLFQSPSSFYAYDFVIGNNENDIWFIGSEDVSGQGERGTIYTCNNPVTPTTDITEEEPLESITERIIVYPNPAQTSVTIKNYSGDVILLNSIGEVVLESSSNTIDISKLNNGMYYITTVSNPYTTTVLSIIR